MVTNFVIWHITQFRNCILFINNFVHTKLSDCDASCYLVAAIKVFVKQIIVSSDDYGSVSGQIIEFNRGDTNQTHTINITQDQICEKIPNDFFLSNLALVSGIPTIDVIQSQARIYINDSLEPECGKVASTVRTKLPLACLRTGLIQVGYDPTAYTTIEGEGMVELSISVFSHPVTGAPRPFTLSVSTQDGTAGMADFDQSHDLMCLYSIL